MPDSPGWRRGFGVIAPSTHSSAQPASDAMRPAGATDRLARIPDMAPRRTGTADRAQGFGTFLERH